MKRILIVTILCSMVWNPLFSQQKTGVPDDINTKFPNIIGNMRFENRAVFFQDIKDYQSLTDTLDFINVGNKPITFNIKDQVEFIQAKAIPSIINPGKKGMLLITFDAKKRGEYGHSYYSLAINTNDTLEPLKIISVSAIIKEDFDKLSAKQLADAPKIEFNATTYDFGTIQDGQEVKFDYFFTNKGKSDLIIRKTHASCGCTSTNPEKSILKPGESSKIGIVFNSTGRKGSQHKTITVISNDPINYQIILQLKGIVQ